MKAGSHIDKRKRGGVSDGGGRKERTKKRERGTQEVGGKEGLKGGRERGK